MANYLLEIWDYDKNDKKYYGGPIVTEIKSFFDAEEAWMYILQRDPRPFRYTLYRLESLFSCQINDPEKPQVYGVKK